MSLPLAGITVVALEQAVAAPFASRQLADLGARVIKIERDSGDFARGYDQTVGGMSSYFVWLNRGKESVVLDLKDPKDFALLSSLVSQADVVIQNLAPGAATRLGLGADDALRLNPRLIYTSISGYGTGGSYEQKKAYDLLVQCEAGMLSVTGTPDAPAKVGVSIADIAAGMYAFSGILTALYHRERSGKGDVLEVSMLEAMGEWMSQPMYFTRYGGTPPPRSGSRHASIAPYGPFDVLDGTVFFAVQNDREWRSFCERVLRDAELADVAAFRSNVDRVANQNQLHAMIDEKLGQLSVAEALTLLDEAQIANARLRSMRDFAEHPQLIQRDRWRDVDSPVGALSALLPPVVSRETDVAMGAIPAIGQHTDAVRREFS